jgi:hypothetical protein
MHKIASATIAAALAGVMAIPAPAMAQSGSVNLSFGQQDRFVSQRCNNNPNWRGCDDFRRNHRNWDRDDYRRWYGSNRSSLGNVGAGIFGFAVGAAIASGINNNSDDGYRRGGNGAYNAHVAACEDRYRSYNAETDTYLGFDGDRHLCRL